jgi:hypothetical protein
MAGTWRAELVTVEQVLEYYNNNRGVRYRVYAGNEPRRNMLRYSFDEDNKSVGMQELSNAVNAIEQNKLNYNQYTLQILESEKKVKAKADGRSSLVEDAVNIVFQLNFPQGSSYNNVAMPMQQMGTSNNKTEQLLEKMIEQQNALLSLFTAKLEADNLDNEEDEPESIGARLAEPLYGLFENPVIQNAIAERITGFLLPNRQPMAVAGMSVDENDKLINEAIVILKQYTTTLGSDLMKLASIAQADKNQFNMLLTVLRGQ